MGRHANRRTTSSADSPWHLRQIGVSLFEIITTLGIASIVGVTALPAMLELVANQRMITAVNSLVTGLNVARSEAITRQRDVFLCPGAPATGCRDASDWHAGYIIFSDENDDEEYDRRDDVLIRVTEPTTTGMRIGGSMKRFVQYQQTGLAGGSNQSISFCDDRGPASGRVVTINNAGRPYASKRKWNKALPDC